MEDFFAVVAIVVLLGVSNCLSCNKGRQWGYDEALCAQKCAPKTGETRGDGCYCVQKAEVAK